jgi:hypothetical protein
LQGLAALGAAGVVVDGPGGHGRNVSIRRSEDQTIDPIRIGCRCRDEMPQDPTQHWDLPTSEH